MLSEREMVGDDGLRKTGREAELDGDASTKTIDELSLLVAAVVRGRLPPDSVDELHSARRAGGAGGAGQRE